MPVSVDHSFKIIHVHKDQGKRCLAGFTFDHQILQRPIEVTGVEKPGQAVVNGQVAKHLTASLELIFCDFAGGVIDRDSLQKGLFILLVNVAQISHYPNR